MKKIATFTANIYLGLQHGYSGALCDAGEVCAYIQNYCNQVKLGVTVTPTEFIYVDGREPGLIIGLINYPRFPRTEIDIKYMAKELAKHLMQVCYQERVSIVFSDETIMIEKEDNEDYK